MRTNTEASYILLFDVGNTNIKLGLAYADSSARTCGRTADDATGLAGLAASYTLPTDPQQTADSLGLRLVEACRHAGVEPEHVAGCAACSVVPGVDPLLGRAVQRYFGQPLRRTPADLPIPLENRYERPWEVGADRLLSAHAARVQFPDAESIVSIDFGTATTFDCVQGNAYLGGLICPGVLSSARALASQTAKLPQITLEVDSDVPVFGRSTAQSLNQGLVFGFASLTDGIIARIAPQLGGSPLVVATGGLARIVCRVAETVDHIRPDLLMEGLLDLFDTNT